MVANANFFLYSFLYLLLLISCGKHNAESTTHETNVLNQKEESAYVSQNREIYETIKEGLPKKKLQSDQDHSSISFRTKHWEIVDIIGWFSDFSVTMYADSTDLVDAVIYAEVNPTSVLIPNEKMTGSVQKSPYIDSELFPNMSFLSTQLLKLSNKEYKLIGHLEVNGIRKETTFDVIFNGFAYPEEKPICGFDVKGKIDRNDFNIAGDDKLHSGKLIHADTIVLVMALRME